MDEPAPPSLKSLGKRRQVSPILDETLAAAAGQVLPAIKKLKASATDATSSGEKRRTRSSLGGQQSDADNAVKDDGAAWKPALPLKTPIFLTLRAPPNLTFHPLASADQPAHVPTPLDAPTVPGSIPPVPAPPPSIPTASDVPKFRLLGIGDGFERSRHAGAAEADTSDAHYQRLHRFPEILEKRSARLERDRLIHERAKLIAELEELRSRGWVYQGAQGGRGEEERKKKIKDREERLKRYDALLPNQPRKSQVLNERASATAPASNSRAASPAFPPSRRPADQVRNSTPLSASGDGGTTIRIKFGGITASTSTARLSSNPVAAPSSGTHKAARLARGKEKRSYDEEDAEDEPDGEENDSADEALPRPKYAKRDRKAERARAADRVRLGLPPRTSIEKAIGLATGKKRKLSTSARTREVDSDDENPAATDSAGDEVDSPRSSAPSGASARRRRMRGSFFESEALRDSVMTTAGRRSSGRVAYAFGQRVLDSTFFQSEFEPHGGISDFDSDDENPPVPLEEMVNQRAGGNRPHRLVVNGVAVPTSAIMATVPLVRAYRAPLSSPVAPKPAQALSAPTPPAPITVILPVVPSPPPQLLPATNQRLTLTVPAANHSHGTRRIKTSVLTMSARGKMELKIKIDE